MRLNKEMTRIDDDGLVRDLRSMLSLLIGNLLRIFIEMISRLASVLVYLH